MPQSTETSPLFRLPQLYQDPLRRTLFSVIKRPLGGILCLKRLNRIYSNLTAQGDDDFTAKVLDYLKVTIPVSEADLARIPAEGPVIVVANHPFGAVEGLILASVLKRVRPDVKIMANYILSYIPQVRDLLIFVDPFGSDQAAKRNIGPLKDCLRWARGGHALGIFPAGEVSSLQIKKRRVTDPEWSPTVARIVRSTKAPVLPVHFKGDNGMLFHLLGLIHPRLRTIMLPRAMLKSGRKMVGLSIGNPIPFAKLDRFQSDEEMTAYLRFRTYLLDEKAERKRFFSLPQRAPQEEEAKPVAPALESETLRAEVEGLDRSQVILESGEFQVFHAMREQIPGVVHEIGRLREKTFRSVGEGTGQPLDLDRFDDTYVHLVLWNKQAGEVVGAYRLGQTDMILPAEGIRGLYTSTLFTYSPELIDRIGPALELGRSFVRKRYQKSYSPLLLLWRGIGGYLLQHPRYRALFGPVSISNDYQAISRELIVRYLRDHESRPDLSGLVRAKTPPKLKALKRMGDQFPVSAIKDLEAMTSLVSEIEADSKGIPVLLRQYLKLGGKILAFNIDHDFSSCLDGLILVDLVNTDEKTLGKYMGKEEASRYLAHHQGKPGRSMDRVA